MGDMLTIDLAEGKIRNLSPNRAIAAATLDKRCIELLAAGGLIPYLRQKLAA